MTNPPQTDGHSGLASGWPIPDGEQAFRQAVTVPFQQALQVQANAAQFLANGLEMQYLLQQRSMELTRQSMQTYLDSLHAMLEGAPDQGRSRGMTTQRGQQTASQQALPQFVPQQLRPPGSATASGLHLSGPEQQPVQNASQTNSQRQSGQ